METEDDFYAITRAYPLRWSWRHRLRYWFYARNIDPVVLFGWIALLAMAGGLWGLVWWGLCRLLRG